MSTSDEKIIQQTKRWMDEIVVGLQLCPFAKKVMRDDAVGYTIIESKNLEHHLQSLADIFQQLDNNKSIETSLLIFPHAYPSFENYLELLLLANILLEDMNYTGTYQLASFHPHYLFDGTTENDASNYSNRSPYPMLHILRESSVEQAIENFDAIDDVPETNIKKLTDIGYESMHRSLQKILHTKTGKHN